MLIKTYCTFVRKKTFENSLQYFYSPTKKKKKWTTVKLFFIFFMCVFSAGMISSDIDTDTEVDIERVGMKHTDDDDDFHDFYQ